MAPSCRASRFSCKIDTHGKAIADDRFAFVFKRHTAFPEEQ